MMDRQKINCNFLGSYEISLDLKNRVSIPSKWRGNIGREIVMFRSPDNVLSITTKETFGSMCADLAGRSSFDKNVRIVRRNLLGNAHEIELDKWCRFVIPNSLYLSNNLGKELRLVGIGESIEIWTREGHDSWMENGENSYEAASQAISTN